MPAPDGTAARWTPGPWRIMELSPREVLLKRRHWAVGQVHAPARGVGLAFGETDANARLIAAAPSLYEALAGLVEELETDGGVDTSEWPILDAARAALALARGDNDA